jgi:hypothetical protein
LSSVKPVRGASEIQFLGDRGEVSQVAQFHGWSLDVPRLADQLKKSHFIGSGFVHSSTDNKTAPRPIGGREQSAARLPWDSL